MYFHVYLIYRFMRTFTDHSSVITRCWGFELQNGKSSLKSPQTLATQDFAPASFLSTHSSSWQATYRLPRAFHFILKLIAHLFCSALRPPLRGGFVLSREDIAFNHSFCARAKRTLLRPFLPSAVVGPPAREMSPEVCPNNFLRRKDNMGQ